MLHSLVFINPVIFLFRSRPLCRQDVNGRTDMSTTGRTLLSRGYANEQCFVTFFNKLPTDAPPPPLSILITSSDLSVRHDSPTLMKMICMATERSRNANLRWHCCKALKKRILLAPPPIPPPPEKP